MLGNFTVFVGVAVKVAVKLSRGVSADWLRFGVDLERVELGDGKLGEEWGEAGKGDEFAVWGRGDRAKGFDGPAVILRGCSDAGEVLNSWMWESRAG